MAQSASDARRLLDEIAADYREVLKENLVGIYEHGSLSLGCFRWEVSDIDFLAVVRQEPDQAAKEKLIGLLLNRTDRAPEKGFEMSVVLAADIQPFRYPTPYVLHFSNAHLKAAKEDLTAYCRQMNGYDRDLAAHCTVTRARGRTVAGEKIAKVFGTVPREAYLDSIWYDIGSAVEDIAENPVYVILNLCRALAAAREGKVLSKQEGGRYALNALNEKWRGLIEGALAAYEKGSAFGPDAAWMREFAGDMLAQIQKG